MGTDQLGDSITDSVVIMHTFIRKVQQLNENLNQVEVMYEDMLVQSPTKFSACQHLLIFIYLQ